MWTIEITATFTKLSPIFSNKSTESYLRVSIAGAWRADWRRWTGSVCRSPDQSRRSWSGRGDPCARTGCSRAWGRGALCPWRAWTARRRRSLVLSPRQPPHWNTYTPGSFSKVDLHSPGIIQSCNNLFIYLYILARPISLHNETDNSAKTYAYKTNCS